MFNSSFDGAIFSREWKDAKWAKFFTAAPEQPAETACMLSSPAKGTMAALKAHGTRWRRKAEKATSEEERQEALLKAEEYDARLAYVR